MTTVEKVLIYEALEKNRQYKEERKEKLLREKQAITVAKSNVSQKTRSQWVSIGKKKIKTKSRSQLVKELDQIFSRYIRLRDADKNGICSCITCSAKVHWKNIQCWHFLTRGNYKYRWSENNCFAQCMPCNIYKSWNYISYTLVMIWKYGEKKVRDMQEDKELVKISTPEIREMIEKYKYEVELLMKIKKV